jgi:N-acetylglucosaminyldiphosphoundecaprenol N-acetyl-beta-D-mannosaminyltransferase
MLSNVQKKTIVNFSWTTGKYQQIVDAITALAKNRVSSTVYFAGVHMFSEAYRNDDFRALVNKADVVAPDGQPIVWMLRILYGIKQDRAAGMDMFPDLLRSMEKENLPVYFYGGSQAMLDKTAEYVKNTYPGLNVTGSYSPPFRPLTESEQNDITEKIKAASPAIVFIILGCPSQERFAAAMKGKINAVMAAVGAAVPVAVGMQTRAPLWMQRSGLEWLFRLFQEPRRLFKRYLTANSLFMWVMFKEVLRVRLLVPLKLSKT